MEAGRYADRLSVNVEIPTEANLRLLAPDKSRESIYTPMSFIHQGVIAGAEERRLFRSAPPFAPAGQSTQMIVGATDERDSEILRLSSQALPCQGDAAGLLFRFRTGEFLRQAIALRRECSAGA